MSMCYEKVVSNSERFIIFTSCFLHTVDISFGLNHRIDDSINFLVSELRAVTANVLANNRDIIVSLELCFSFLLDLDSAMVSGRTVGGWD